MKYEDYAWTFDDEDVANEFDVHVRQSVPLYETFHSMVVNMSKYAIQDNTKVVDIGCSTGHLLKSLNEANKKKDVEFVGLDVSEAMIEFCKKIMR